MKVLEIGTFVLGEGILDRVGEVISKQSQIQVLKAANAEPFHLPALLVLVLTSS